MHSFLKIVADDLRRRIGSNLSRTIVVFPNKRASLFLNENLLQPGEAPIWAPRYMAINEFFRSLTATRIADPIETVCRLYRHYRKFTGNDESLDAFYGWGERLLADFDDLDKSMAPAEQVFANLKDFASIDGSETCLTDEQIVQLRHFADAMGQNNPGVIRSRFMKLWQQMLPIYNALRGELAAEGLAYEGQLYREVATAFSSGEASLPEGVSTIAFVGLNVLNKAEQTMFRALQAQGKALFYWDYDTTYASLSGTSDSEAGTFLQQNLKEFPNAIDNENEHFCNFLQHRNDGSRTIEFVSSPTETAQAQSVSTWLSDARNFDASEARQTAVVLCNESLLQPVLHALPASINEVNVTKGFPLSHTPAYNLIVRLSDTFLQEESKDNASTGTKRDAQKKSTSSAEQTIQTVALLQKMQDTISEEAAKKNSETKADSFLNMLYTESYYQTHTTLSRFIALVEKGFLIVTSHTIFRLLRQTLSLQSIAFHGEPATGLQVMGVLETRCLDFKRVLMLSVSEGFLPQKASEASFIPYLIRKHFGMTTSEHKTSVYAYYFHRLLQRAEHVRLEYTDTTNGLKKCEMSRFMKAMLIEGLVPITRYQLTSSPHPYNMVFTSAPKPKDMAERVMKKVSPTKINTYMRCQLLFYFKYVLGLKEDTTDDIVIAANAFGTVLHRAAELFFNDMQQDCKGDITPTMLKKFLENDSSKDLEDYVLRAYEDAKKKQHKDLNPEIGNLSRYALMKYLRNIIEFEAGANKTGELPAQRFHISENSNGTLTLEENTLLKLRVPYGDNDELSAEILFEGNIDRLDEATLADGSRHLRIIDYKTGGHMEEAKSMEALFTPGSNHPHYVLQTFLYALSIVGRTKLPIAPALYFVNHMLGKDFTPYIKFQGEPMLDFASIADEFKERLIDLLAEMLNPHLRFMSTTVAKNCKTCSFAELCGRG